MSKKVYVFRGAPASGKGTVVPRFCKSLEGPIALIEQDNFRWGIHTFGRPVTDIRDEEHALANRVTMAVFEEYLRTGMHSVVIEGLFTWDDSSSSQGNASELIALSKKYEYIPQSIVLRATKQELMRRNSARRGNVVPATEFDSLYANVYKTIDPSEIVVDSTGMTAAETIATVRTALGLNL